MKSAYQVNGEFGNPDEIVEMGHRFNSMVGDELIMEKVCYNYKLVPSKIQCWTGLNVNYSWFIASSVENDGFV
jgi:hypothetical protein